MKNVALAVLILTTAASCQKNVQNTTVSTEAYEVPASFKVEPLLFMVNPMRDTTLRIGLEGSELHIPKMAFVNARGVAVETPVVIEFAEYTNAAQIAFSGIPMTYNNGSEVMDFNSSGMFDISGSSNGEAVQVANGKSLKMDYKLAVKNNDIDFYFLDPSAKTWALVQEIEPQTVLPEASIEKSPQPDLKVDYQELSDSSVTVQIKDPPKPVEAKANDERIIQITIEDENLPEFKSYNNVMFRISEKSTINKNDKTCRWYIFNMKPSDIAGEYKLFLQGSDAQGKTAERDYIVTPVYEGEDLKKAQKEYDKKLVAVEKERTKQADERKKVEEESARNLAKAQKEMEAQRIAWERENERRVAAQTKADEESMNAFNQLANQRTLPVTDPGHTYPNIVMGLTLVKFGVYNCDQIMRVNDRVNIAASYVDEQNRTISQTTVLSVINLSYNAAFSFSPQNFTCGKSSRTVLLLFTKSNQLYMLDEAGWSSKRITANGSQTFRMKDVTEQFKSSADLAAYLKL